MKCDMNKDVPFSKIFFKKTTEYSMVNFLFLERHSKDTTVNILFTI